MKLQKKTNTKDNFTDVYNHLWDRSRPTIVEMERKIKRKPVKLLIATEIETLVESMFEEEEDCGLRLWRAAGINMEINQME